MTFIDEETPTLFMFAIRDDGRFIIDVETGDILWKFEGDALTGGGAIDLAKGVSCAEWMNWVATKPVVARWIICEWDGDHELGHGAGHFYTELMRACGRADNENLTLLKRGFPALVGAVLVWQNISGSPQLLRKFLREEWWVRKVPA